MQAFVTEPEKKIPVCADVDVCVIGGSCTGVFAAVRAARAGAKVAIIEKQNGFGGSATAALVNIWHSLHSTDGNKQIIAGLTQEVIDRLERRGGIVREPDKPWRAYSLNTAELKTVLDELVKENHILPFLHTYYAACLTTGNHVDAVLVENKDGRCAIRAKFFIDASGDGDLARDLHRQSYIHPHIQPPTGCFYLSGKVSDTEMARLVREHGREYGLDDDWGWNNFVVNADLTMRADWHVFDLLCSNVSQLTAAEMESRRKMTAFVEMLNRYGSDPHGYGTVVSGSTIGIRETVHYKTGQQITGRSLLFGTAYEDAVLYGSYRIDRHHDEDNGITFLYLDGHQETIYGKDEKKVLGDWREEYGFTGETKTYYQVSFRSLVDEEIENFIAVGRMIHADESAFGAVRVMVNLNQLGEAAGTAAVLALERTQTMQQIDGREVRRRLNQGGSALT